MNYLAHLALSNRDPAIMLGNFIADDIPRKEEKDVPKDVMKGIKLHRRIDEFTDDHKAFKKAVKKLRKHHRKYAPVVLDILNDHLLSRNWHLFYNGKQRDFHRFVYDQFHEHVIRLPPKVSLHVHTLLEYEYLAAYNSREGIEGVLKRMDRRTRFPSNFSLAGDHLYEDYSFFEEQFVILYEDLNGFVGG